MMTLGERCDEIVRLIEETLVAVVADVGPPADAHRQDTDLLTRRPHPGESAVRRRRRRGGNVRL
jgi:hypothetical protein